MSKDIADFYLLIKTTFFTYLSMSVRSHIVEALHSFPIAKFHPASLSLLRHYSFNEFTNDLSAGLTVGVVALPLAMAFAIASGMTPESGIYTAIIAGFFISLLGGCRVQIGRPCRCLYCYCLRHHRAVRRGQSAHCDLLFRNIPVPDGAL